MKSKYKLLALIPLVLTCSDESEDALFGGKFVVQKVCDNQIVTTDKQFTDNTTFVMDIRDCDHLSYVSPGDTIEYFDTRHPLCKKNNIVYIPANGYLKFNSDSLEARQNRRFYAHTRYEKMMIQR